MLVRIGLAFRGAFVMSIKKIISLFLLLLGFVELRAQVDAQFSQYWALPNYYNAGAVGHRDWSSDVCSSDLTQDVFSFGRNAFSLI